MSQDEFERGALTGLLVFAAAVGTFALVGVLLVLMQLAAETAAALAAAAPAGLGISLATIRCRKG
jgi:heme A synthase